jgi:hypothetical protein
LEEVGEEAVKNLSLVLTLTLGAAVPQVQAGPLYTLDARLAGPKVHASSFVGVDEAKVTLTKQFLSRPHLYYFAVTATSEKSIDMGVLSEVVLVKHVLEGDEVKFVRATATESGAESEVLAAFKAKSVGDKVEVDFSTDMGIQLEGGAYKAPAPTTTRDVDNRPDRLAYTQVFDLVREKPAEGAEPEREEGEKPPPQKVTLGLRFILLERENAGYKARSYPEADRHRLGYFTLSLFAGDNSAPPPSADYLLRRDARKPIVYTLHPNIPSQYRETITKGILSWNKVFKATVGAEPIKVEQGKDPNLIPGDPDLNLIYWFPKDVPKMYLGQAHPLADPRTGEIFSSYMLLSEQEFQGAIEQTAVGIKIDGPNTPPPAPETELTAMVRLRRGAGLALVSRREGLSRGAARAAVMEAGTGSMMDRIINWTVPHETGHSLGLRHNFKSTTDVKNFQTGQYSATVMEYLPPMQAPSSPQGYDYAAIAYGYDGSCPSQFNKSYAYGTDEDSITDPDTNTYDLGEPLTYLTDHWRHIRQARPTIGELSDPSVYLSLLYSAVQPLTKFMGAPSDTRHAKAMDFMVSNLANQGNVAATAGGNGGSPDAAPVEEFLYTKNLMERAALMRAFSRIPKRLKPDAQAAAKVISVLEKTMTDAPKTDVFTARMLALRALLAFGDAGKMAMVRAAKEILAYAKSHPQAATLQQEAFLLKLTQMALTPPRERASAEREEAREEARHRTE